MRGFKSTLCGLICVAAADENRNSALHFACGSGCAKCAKSIVDHAGASAVNAVNEDGDTPLHRACTYGHVECVELLLGFGCDPNTRNANGETPLAKAAFFAKEHCVKTMLHAKADPNKVGFNGGTALHAVVAGGDLAVLRILLDVPGIQVDARDGSLWTPLCRAISGQKKDLVAALLKAGASTTNLLAGMTLPDWAK